MGDALREGVRYLINPGSVGQPRDDDWRGVWRFRLRIAPWMEFYRVPYDLKTAQEKILEAQLPPRRAAIGYGTLARVALNSLPSSSGKLTLCPASLPPVFFFYGTPAFLPRGTLPRRSGTSSRTLTVALVAIPVRRVRRSLCVGFQRQTRAN